MLLLLLTRALADLLRGTASAWGSSQRRGLILHYLRLDDNLRLFLSALMAAISVGALEGDQVGAVERLHHQLLEVCLTCLEKGV